MGFTKERLLNDQELNYSTRHIEDNYVCAHHIDDYAIKNFILTYSDMATCTYCKRKRKVALVTDVVEFINNGLGAFYEDPANSVGYDSAEGGYLLPVYEINELLNEEIELDINNYQLQNDIINAFDNTPWVEIDPYADRESDSLSYNWNYFKNIIKHKSRFLFSQTEQFNDDIQNVRPYEILHDVGRKVDQLDLFTNISSDTLFYRVRQHAIKDEVKGAKDIASPPVEYATFANRMSPAGISMFYCAFDKATAISETLEKSNTGKPFYSVGKFKNKEDLFLLDLSKPLEVPSIFDEKNRRNYFSIIFLKRFIDDLTREIRRDGFEHIDYIPTQIVTEYFRYTFCDLSKIKLDGIIYPSAKRKGKKACVLFFDHEESLQCLHFVGHKSFII